MRREPPTRPENVLALAVAEIERIKALLARLTDGRRLVIQTGTGPGDTTPPPAAAQHTLYGVKQTRALRISDGGGLNINFDQGQIWVGGTFYNIVAGSLAMTDASTNNVFVSAAGAVASNTTTFPSDSVPLATVVTAGADITSINDRRSYLLPGASTSGSSHDASEIIDDDLDTGVEVERTPDDDIVRLRAATIDVASIGVAGQWALPIIGVGAGVLVGGDAQWYRSGVDIMALGVGDTLRIDDADFTMGMVGGDPRINFDSGDYLYWDTSEDDLVLAVGSVDFFAFHRFDANQIVLEKRGSGGTQQFRYEFPDVVDDDTLMRFLRLTNTTGDAAFEIFRGDGTADHIFRVLRRESGLVQTDLYGDVQIHSPLSTSDDVAIAEGKTSIGGSTDTVAAGSAELNASKFVLSNGRLQSLSAYVESVTGSTETFRIAIYDDLAGAPNNFILATGSLVAPVNGAPALVTGTTFFDALGRSLGPEFTTVDGTHWLVVHNEGTQGIILRYDTGAAGDSFENNVSTPFGVGPEDPWSGGASGTKQYSIQTSIERTAILDAAIFGGIVYHTSEDSSGVVRPMGPLNDAYNGMFLEPFDFPVTSDGVTIIGTIDKKPTGDLTELFSDGTSILTSGSTVTLTPGSDTAPVKNFIYVLQSNKGVMVVSTAGWPATEHNKISEVIVQSAATVQADVGGLVNRCWNDFTKGEDGQGHHLHAWERLRFEHSAWQSGAAITWTITTNGGSPDNVDLAVTAAKVYQLHLQDAEAKDTAAGDNIHVVNDSATPYIDISDFNALLTDSTGAAMTGRYFNLVVWSTISSNTEIEHLFVNLPSGSYNKQGDALADVSGFTNFTIPSDYRGASFLVTRITLRHQNASGGTWTSIRETDLRGQIPNIIAGGGTAAITTEFADTQFKVFDDGDPSKEFEFQLSGVSASTLRTLTVPDASGVIALTSQTDGTIDHGVDVVGLLGDDHTIYALLAGRATGQTLRGGIDASENLTLESTLSGTKGSIRLLDTVEFGGLPAFNIDLSGVNREFNFDTDDRWAYDPAANHWDWIIAATTRMRLNSLGLNVSGTSGIETIIRAGVADTTPGQLRAEGGTTGSAVGGKMRLSMAADHDTTDDFWELRVDEDDMIVGLGVSGPVMRLNADRSLDLSPASSMTIPNADAPTVDAVGELALDTLVASHDDMLTFFDSDAQQQHVVSLLLADFTAVNNHVIVYDSVLGRFIMEAQTGGPGGHGTIETISDHGDVSTMSEVEGDLFVFDSGTEWGRLPIGTNPYMTLQVNSAGTAPEWRRRFSLEQIQTRETESAGSGSLLNGIVSNYIRIKTQSDGPTGTWGSMLTPSDDYGNGPFFLWAKPGQVVTVNHEDTSQGTATRRLDILGGVDIELDGDVNEMIIAIYGAPTASRWNVRKIGGGGGGSTVTQAEVWALLPK